MQNPVRPDEWPLFEDLEPSRMLELGNKKNSQSGITYKAWFESLGFEHVSVDWNGLDGALKKDLQKPIKLGLFDVVSNVGTTEHVEDQEAVWRNIHESLEVGGYLISITPKGDGKNWPHHGFWYPKHSFFKDFAESNGYEVVSLYDGKEQPTAVTYCKLKKVKDKPFSMPSMETIYKNDTCIHC